MSYVTIYGISSVKDLRERGVFDQLMTEQNEKKFLEDEVGDGWYVGLEGKCADHIRP